MLTLAHRSVATAIDDMTAQRVSAATVTAL